ncbi:hypothetical protein AVDCRST_MAG82-1639, partial [uncultured Rubrobacteraceae bacterium]
RTPRAQREGGQGDNRLAAAPRPRGQGGCEEWRAVALGRPQGRRDCGRGDARGGRDVEPAPRRPVAHAESCTASEGSPALPDAGKSM